MAEQLKVRADLDDTFTDGEKEADTYVPAYAYALARETRTPVAEVFEGIERGTQTILTSPGMFGWETDYSGQKVIGAPAEVNTVLMNQTAAFLWIQEQRGQTGGRGIVLPSPDETDEFLNNLHREAQMKTGVIFKDDAAKVIRELRAISDFGIITNSSVGNVAKAKSSRWKLAVLLGEEEANTVNLIGEARKNQLDASWTLFPAFKEIETFPGKARAVYLGRRKYYDALMSPDDRRPNFVFGDIYHLDLAVPEQMGSFTGLVTSKITPNYYALYYKKHPNGRAFSSLGQIPGVVRQMRV